MKKFFIVLIFSSFLASCGFLPKANSGENFDLQSTTKVRRDMTKKQVLEAMGKEPQDINVSEESETWIWVYAETDRSKAFAVTFNKSGRVINTSLTKVP